MKWSWKLGTFAGIDVFIHATFLLIIGWVGFSYWQQTGTLAGTLEGKMEKWKSRMRTICPRVLAKAHNARPIGRSADCGIGCCVEGQISCGSRGIDGAKQD